MIVSLHKTHTLRSIQYTVPLLPFLFKQFGQLSIYYSNPLSTPWSVNLEVQLVLNCVDSFYFDFTFFKKKNRFFRNFFYHFVQIFAVIPWGVPVFTGFTPRFPAALVFVSGYYIFESKLDF